MKLKYKKENSPRMQSAINRVLTHVYTVLTIARCGRYRIVYNPFSSSDIGVSILMLAYGADKYDVLNRLSTPDERLPIAVPLGIVLTAKTVISAILIDLQLDNITTGSVMGSCKLSAIALSVQGDKTE